ncbi:hypothetical protein [Nocardia panacis]|uniref:hypothetical protein n=1 Tax=Nocardia panacis TaxID=2340916 RepID=UPI0013159AB0|nr:hypothetical protein [Nocardia panacis]
MGDMLHLIAGDFATLGNDVLSIGHALVVLIQDAINAGTQNAPGYGHGGGAGQFPLN